MLVMEIWKGRRGEERKGGSHGPDTEESIERKSTESPHCQYQCQRCAHPGNAARLGGYLSCARPGITGKSFTEYRSTKYEYSTE
jgi:hypothetical protein